MIDLTIRLDPTIRPLLIALNRVGIKTRLSCSGILDDHIEFPMGMGTPYLCVDTYMTANAKLKWLEVIMKDVGFRRSGSAFENLKEWAKKRGETLTKAELWEAESRSHSICFYFDFRTDFYKDRGWDRDYDLIDLPEWQRKIREAWINLYKKLLHGCSINVGQIY